MAALHKDRTGTTLIELMIICAIISVLSAMAIPSWINYMPKIRAKAAVRAAVSSLREARSQAITEKKRFGVFFDATNRNFVLFADKANPGNGTFETGDSVITTTALGSNSIIEYTTFVGSAVVFDMNGAASQSGTVTFLSYQAQLRYVIDILAATGRVKMTAG